MVEKRSPFKERRTQRAHRRVGLPLRGVRRSCAGMGDGRCGLLPRPITRQKGVNYAQANSVKSAHPVPPGCRAGRLSLSKSCRDTPAGTADRCPIDSSSLLIFSSPPATLYPGCYKTQSRDSAHRAGSCDCAARLP